MAATCVRMVGAGAALRMLETRDWIEWTREEVWSSRKIYSRGKGGGGGVGGGGGYKAGSGGGGEGVWWGGGGGGLWGEGGG